MSKYIRGSNFGTKIFIGLTYFLVFIKRSKGRYVLIQLSSIYFLLSKSKKNILLKNLICKEMEDFKIKLGQKYLLYFYNIRFRNEHLSEMINLLHYRYFKYFYFLSKKEKECLYLAVQGKTIKETANILNIKYEIVREYRKHSIKKMNARNITEATVKFYEYENRSS